jgi:phage baseplate assembly protein W
MDPRSYLGRGWSFPVRLQGRSGAIRVSEYDEDVRESIRIILSTSKGERVMQPEFGCGIHDLVFAVINTTTMADIEDSVRRALAMFEPRIDVVQVTVAAATQGVDGKLEVSIDYVIRGTNNQLNFVFPFYLRERG